MDAVVMCGGKGTRLESTHEKPLHPIDGTAMVDRVLSGLRESRVERIHAAVSPNAPATAAHLDDVATIETAGDGYVTDLTVALEHPAIEPPILTVAADLPLLEGPAVDRVLATHGDGTGSRTVCVPAALKRRLGVSADAALEPETHLMPTGVNVVGDADDSTTMVSYDPRLAVNVNRREDARIAADRLRRSEGR